MDSIVGVDDAKNRTMNNSVPSESSSRRSESLAHLRNRIHSLLFRWNALQMAVQNQWGGVDSLQKSHQLAVDILSWFSNQIAPVCPEDVENWLHESMLLTFNVEIEDGSIEKVAEEMMIMLEDYLHK